VIALREGAAAVAHGKPAAAEAAFDHAIKLHEADKKLYQALGAPYRERGFDQVLAEARKGLGGEPPLASWVAYQTRGLEREKNGDYLGAARDFGAAIRAGPTNTALHFLRGNALLKAEKPAEAAMEFEKGLKIEPGNATLRQLLQQARASIGWQGSTASTDKNPNPQ
jgi:tetratricopeptide (TPR) repeat protein